MFGHRYRERRSFVPARRRRRPLWSAPRAPRGRRKRLVHCSRWRAERLHAWKKSLLSRVL
eukprot:951782-Lingulodinium_polyedra.AAC.1